MLNTNKWVAQSKKYTANSKNLLLMKSKSNHKCFLFFFLGEFILKWLLLIIVSVWLIIEQNFAHSLNFFNVGKVAPKNCISKIWSDTEFARSCHLSVEHRPFIIWDWPFTIRDWLSVVRDSIFPFYSPPPPLMLPFVHTYVYALYVRVHM